MIYGLILQSGTSRHIHLGHVMVGLLTRFTIYGMKSKKPMYVVVF